MEWQKTVQYEIIVQQPLHPNTHHNGVVEYKKVEIEYPLHKYCAAEANDLLPLVGEIKLYDTYEGKNPPWKREEWPPWRCAHSFPV